MSRPVAPVLILTVAQRALILADAAARFPAEACGLLIGSDEPAGIRVLEVVAAPNTDPRPDRFEVDPRILFATHRRIRARPDLRLVGHYHSHPNGLPRPSPTDLSRAWEPGAIWLIAAIASDGTGQLNAFLFDEPGFRDLPILMDGHAAENP